MEWRIGLSGFHYREWKGHFYPTDIPQRLWFDHYCKHFNTLELNSTFYNFPKLHILQKWFNDSPPGFCFAVKAPRSVTHYKQFNGCAELITSFYDTVSAGLQHKLGPVLFQLPPSFSYTPERLDRVLQYIDQAFTNVIEFRHATWWTDDVYKRLTAQNVIFSGVSHPKLANDDAIANINVAYYRFHGVPVMFSSSYSDEFIKRIADQLHSNSGLKQSWVYFNNTMHLAAIENAGVMKRYIEEFKL